jgi:hypothetical protein
MLRSIAFLVIAAALGVGGNGNLQATEMAAELIGAPVFAADGPEVGTVVDVSFDDDGQPQRLRMRTAAHLGLGERMIDVPKDAFITLRGAAVLEVPADLVQELPDAAGLSSDEK